MRRIQQFINQSIRVYKVTRKPTKEEYKMIVKMSAIGITIIGMIGFIITYIRELFR